MSTFPHAAGAESSWFYSEAGNEPIGPMSFAELKRLAESGAINASSFAIEEGGTEWKRLGSIFQPSKPKNWRFFLGEFLRFFSDRERRLPVFLALLLCYPVGLYLLLKSHVFTRRSRVATAVAFGAICLFLGLKEGTTLLGAMPRSIVATGPRYAIEKGGGGFADRAAVVEFLQVRPKKEGDEQQLQVSKELRIRREHEGRRFDFPHDMVVRMVKEEPELQGVCEVIAEDGSGLKNPHFWVHKSFLETEDSLFGSRILTGYTIFRGNNGTSVGGADVSDLLDLLVAVYDGKISDEAARKCVFMPEAQSGEVQTVADGYVIYQARYATWRELVVFAMPLVGGNDHPLGRVPVCYAGREQFTTKSGVVVSVPIVVPHKL